MKAYFSHGKESGPWGSKIKTLVEITRTYGIDADSIDYTDTMDPDIRVDRLVENISDGKGDIILVGSSMGGYVSLVASQTVKVNGVFLLAPALKMPGYSRQEYLSLSPVVEIVHGWSDDVIPPEHSIQFARERNSTLHLIDGDHRLNSSMDSVIRLYEQFLDKMTRSN